MHVTRLAYNCPPDTLGDVEQAAYADAFENEIAAVPLLRNADVRVTFDAGLAGKLAEVGFAGDHTDADYDRVAELVERAAGRAFQACLSDA